MDDVERLLNGQFRVINLEDISPHAPKLTLVLAAAKGDADKVMEELQKPAVMDQLLDPEEPTQ
jgi:hypothetical protein